MAFMASHCAPHSLDDGNRRLCELIPLSECCVALLLFRATNFGVCTFCVSFWFTDFVYLWSCLNLQHMSASRNSCEIAIQLNESAVYTILNAVHLITCVLSVILAFRLQNAWHSRVYFHANVKTLLATMLCLAVLHAITMSSFLLLNLFTWLVADGSCGSYLFNGTMCLLLRHPTNVCIAGLVLCQLSIAIERVVATWIGPEYNTYSNKIGKILSIATVSTAVILLGPLLANETTAEAQINCGFTSSTATAHNWTLMLELLAIDVLSLIVFLIVYAVSKYMKTGAMFQLERRYQINETLYVTRLLLPVTFVHFLLFAILCSAIVLIEMMFQDPFTIIYYETAPFYTVLFPLIVLHAIRQLDRYRKSKSQKMSLDSQAQEPILIILIVCGVAPLLIRQSVLRHQVLVQLQSNFFIKPF